MNKSELTALLLFCVIYAFITVPMAMLPSNLVGLLMYCLYLVLSLCIAFDLTEIVLSIAWGAIPVQRTETPAPRTTTAVLMVICDDSTDACLHALSPLAEAGYAVFVLDDSDVEINLPCEVSKQVKHIKRDGRAGAKAGNLNNWLVQHGTGFEHAIVLDSDSQMSVCCADALLASAVHPANSHVAMFQSKILSQSDESLFSVAIASASQPRMRILERVHTRLGLLLSAGHNVLVRLEPLRKLGGFDQTITAEDTALSLDLASRGWGISLVDAWSEDADPSTIAAYNRRTIRWARQTVELLRCPWSAAPCRLKLLLVRHFLNYLFPVFGTVMLLLSVWCGPSRLDDAFAVIVSALRFRYGFESLGLAVWTSILVTGLLPTLRLYLGIAEGVGMRRLILGILFSGANYPALIVPLVRGMLTSAFGRKVVFLPTNSRTKMGQHGLQFRYEAVLSSFCLSAILVTGIVMHPASGLVGFTGMWLCCFLVSPLALRLTEHLYVMKAHLRAH